MVLQNALPISEIHSSWVFVGHIKIYKSFTDILHHMLFACRKEYFVWVSCSNCHLLYPTVNKIHVFCYTNNTLIIYSCVAWVRNMSIISLLKVITEFRFTSSNSQLFILILLLCAGCHWGNSSQHAFHHCSMLYCQGKHILIFCKLYLFT